MPVIRDRWTGPGSLDLLLASIVYDVADQRLLEAGLPLMEVWIPMPGSGPQKEFRSAFWQAMGKAGWDPDPVILGGNCISFWLDALEHTEPPNDDDRLTAQKIVLGGCSTTGPMHFRIRRVFVMRWKPSRIPAGFSSINSGWTSISASCGASTLMSLSPFGITSTSSA